MERNLDNLSNELKGRKTSPKTTSARTTPCKSLAGAIRCSTPRGRGRVLRVIRQRMKQPPNDKLIDSCDNHLQRPAAQQQEKLAVIADRSRGWPDSLLRRIDNPCSGTPGKVGPIRCPAPGDREQAPSPCSTASASATARWEGSPASPHEATEAGGGGKSCRPS